MISQFSIMSAGLPLLKKLLTSLGDAVKSIPYAN